MWMERVKMMINSSRGIQYVVGDATQVVRGGEDGDMIVHICNNQGGWGAGFVVALSAKFGGRMDDSNPEWVYRQSVESGGCVLGTVSYAYPASDLAVANMVSQVLGWGSDGMTPPIRYDVIEKCLSEAMLRARRNRLTVHMPRIGCGLAGGDWVQVEAIILRVQ